jgi:hypothetical protein
MPEWVAYIIMGFCFFVVFPIAASKFNKAKEVFYSSNPSVKKKISSISVGFDFASNIIAWIFFPPLLVAILAGYFLKDGIVGWGLFWLYIAFFWFGTALYLIPTYVCILRKVKQKAGIILLNIFLGWSILGWVGALIWASIAPAIKNKKTTKIGSA